jgi:hypothetical protein
METQQIMEMLKAMQAKAEADRELMIGIMDANTKAFREKTDALVANIKTACQYAMETSLKKIEPNSGEKETLVC